MFFPLIIFCFPPPPTFRSLRVASVNVHGLKNNSKRLALFHKLKSIRYDVIYLQETHMTLQEESLYTSEWSGSSFWNSYKSNESGSGLVRRDFQTSCKRRAQGHARSKYHHRHRVMRIYASSWLMFTLPQEVHGRKNANLSSPN